MLCHEVQRADVNRQYGQIRKIRDTRLKMRLEYLVRVTEQSHVTALAPTLLSFVFCPVGEYFVPWMQWAVCGSMVESMCFVRHGDSQLNVRKRTGRPFETAARV